jgi:hypothetical protein
MRIVSQLHSFPLALSLASLSLTVAGAPSNDLEAIPAARLKRVAIQTESIRLTGRLQAAPSEVPAPNGHLIARVRNVAKGLESRRSRIVITGRGRRPVALATVVNYFGLGWSPGGTKIAYSEGAVVHLIDVDGRTRQTIYTGPGGPYPGAAFDIAWADNGRTLSFTQVENAEQLDLSSPLRVIITLGDDEQPH